MGDLRPWCPRSIEFTGIEVGRSEAQARREVDGSGDRFAWQRGLEELNPCLLRCETSGPVHLDVVGVAVSATGVVSDQEVRVFFPEHLCDLLADYVRRNVGETVGRRSVESGIGVPEVHHTVHTQDLRGGGQLLRAGGR